MNWQWTSTIALMVFVWKNEEGKKRKKRKSKGFWLFLLQREKIKHYRNTENKYWTRSSRTMQQMCKHWRTGKAQEERYLLNRKAMKHSTVLPSRKTARRGGGGWRRLAFWGYAVSTLLIKKLSIRFWMMGSDLNSGMEKKLKQARMTIVSEAQTSQMEEAPKRKDGGNRDDGEVEEAWDSAFKGLSCRWEPDPAPHWGLCPSASERTPRLRFIHTHTQQRNSKEAEETKRREKKKWLERGNFKIQIYDWPLNWQ